MALEAMPGRNWDRLTVALAAAYTLTIALALRPSDASGLLFSEGLFAGPVILACLLSTLLVRLRARIILLGFAVGYSILSAIIFYWTFGFEHDAQYQLILLLIPMLGFPSLVVAGLFAAIMR